MSGVVPEGLPLACIDGAAKIGILVEPIGVALLIVLKVRDVGGGSGGIGGSEAVVFGSASGAGDSERVRPKEGKSKRETPELQPPTSVNADTAVDNRAQRPTADQDTRACIPPYPSNAYRPRVRVKRANGKQVSNGVPA